MVAQLQPFRDAHQIMLEVERTGTAHDLGKVIYEASVNEPEMFEAVSAMLTVLSDSQWGDEKTPHGRKLNESVEDLVAGFTYQELLKNARRFKARHPETQRRVRDAS